MVSINKKGPMACALNEVVRRAVEDRSQSRETAGDAPGDQADPGDRYPAQPGRGQGSRRRPGSACRPR